MAFQAAFMRYLSVYLLLHKAVSTQVTLPAPDQMNTSFRTFIVKDVCAAVERTDASDSE